MKLCIIRNTYRISRFMFMRKVALRRGYALTIRGSLWLLLLIALGCATGNVGPTPILVKRTQMHMGTWVSITAVASDRETAQNATSAAFEEIHRLDALLSTWIKDSELSRVNGAAGKEAVVVSPDTMKVLQASVAMARLTEGGFNILVGPAVEAWSVLDRQQIPAESDLERIRPLTNLNALQLNQAQGTVYLEKSGMRVDVGGIGKGFAADMAVEAMQKSGATAGVVALSGDIRTFGHLPDGTTFPFAIRHPRREGAVLAFIDLQNEAISTAGDYERYFERDGIRYHHVLDPMTLQPARDCQSVTVVAKDGLTADGLDTGIFVMGRERGLALVETLPGVGAVVVDRDGKVWVSSSLQGRVRIKNDGE